MRRAVARLRSRAAQLRRLVRLERGEVVLDAALARATPGLVVGALLLVVLAAHAAYFVWLCDDAFISFRYARNLLEGRGLVFNPGERVEGYTNFLWVLEVAGLWALGLRPEVSAIALSIGFTVGTVALALRLAWATPVRGARGLAVLGTLALLATDRNVAVWTTGGGLETRQLTFFLLAGYARLVLGSSPARFLHASLLFAAASLTRPEGPLFFTIAAGLVALDGLRGRGLPLARLAALVVPFALVVGAHLAFRVAYYGEWAPNTFYAKAVRPWPEMGLTYLVFAAIESGLYAVLPLAAVGLVARSRARGSFVEATPLLWVAAHAAYLVSIGGDHFELRPLDVWWPPIFVAATDGLLVVLRGLREALFARVDGAVPAPAFTAALLVLLAYARVFQVGHELTTYELSTRDETYRLYRPLTLERFPAGHALPFFEALRGVYEAAARAMAEHSVGTRWREHRAFAQLLLEHYRPYEPARASAKLPRGSVMAHGTVGILPFYLPDLEVVDTLGLTDATVARAGGAMANHERQMAHDRTPPPGYLRSRGVNLYVLRATASREEALALAPYALEVTPRLFMPFLSERPEWVDEAFAGRRLHRAGGPPEERDPEP